MQVEDETYKKAPLLWNGCSKVTDDDYTRKQGVFGPITRSCFKTQLKVTYDWKMCYHANAASLSSVCSSVSNRDPGTIHSLSNSMPLSIGRVLTAVTR